MKKSTQTIALAQPPFWKKYMHIILCALAFVLYANTLNNGYNMDDELVTRKHKLTSKGIAAIPEIFTSPYYSDNMGYSYEYRPVVLTSFAIEHQFFGDKAGMSHFINLLLYVLTVFCLFRLLNKLFHSYSYWLSVLAVLLFLVHPIHVESVASIKNRDEILALLFSIWSWGFALKYVSQNKILHLFLSVLMFVLGLLSKMSIAPLVFLIPLSVIYFVETQHAKRILFLGLALIVPAFFLFPVNNPLQMFPLFLFAGVLLWVLLKVNTNPQLVKAQIINNTGAIFNSFKTGYKELILVDEGKFGFKLIPNALNILSINLGIHISILFILGFGAYYYASLFILILSFLYFVFLLFYSYEGQKSIFSFIYSFIFSILCIYFKINYLLEIFFLLYLFQFLFKKQFQNMLMVLSLLAINAGFIYYNLDYLFDFIPIIIFFLLVRFSNKHILVRIASYIYLVGSMAALVLLIKNFTEGSVTPFVVIWDIGKIILFVVLVFIKTRKYFTPSIVFSLVLFISLIGFGIKKDITDEISPLDEKVEIAILEKDLTGLQKDTSSTSDGIAPGLLFTSERPISFAETPVDKNTPIDERIGMASDAMGFYLKKMFIPYPLGYYYGYAFFEPVSIFSFWPAISFLIHLGLFIFALYAFRRNKVVSFGILFYLLSIVLFSGFLYPVVGVAGDRFAYVASTGFCISIASILIRFLKPSETMDKMPKIFLPTVAVVFIIYGLITVNRAALWASPLKLMGHDIEYLENSSQANNLYALNLMRESVENKKLRPDQQFELRKLAVLHFDKALQIWSDFFNAAYDKGRASLMVGDYASAIDGFEKAVAIGPQKGFIQPYIQLSELYLQTGRHQDYLNNAKTLLTLSEEAETYNMVAKGFYMIGINDSAKYYLHKGMGVFPNDVSLRKNIAEIYRIELQKDSMEYYLR